MKDKKYYCANFLYDYLNKHCDCDKSTKKSLKEKYLRHLVFEDMFSLETYVNENDIDVVNITSYTNDEMETKHILWYWFHTDPKYR